MKRYITHSKEWPMQDKLCAAKGLLDTPQYGPHAHFLITVIVIIDPE